MWLNEWSYLVKGEGDLGPVKINVSKRVCERLSRGE